MKTFEYKIYRCDYANANVERDINKLGREGWELVTDLSRDPHGSRLVADNAYSMVFKRPSTQTA
jgi:hypothetical protein